MGQEDPPSFLPPGTMWLEVQAGPALTWVSLGGQVHYGPGPLDSSPPPLLSVSAARLLPCPAVEDRKVPVAGSGAGPLAPQPGPASPTPEQEAAPTVSSNSSFSLRARRGHQPLTRFCLKMETSGTSTSPVAISMVHCLAVFAPRGNRFRSSSMAPVATPESALGECGKDWDPGFLGAFLAEWGLSQPSPTPLSPPHPQRCCASLSKSC